MVISYNLIIITDIIFEGGRMSTHLHLVLSLRMSGVMPSWRRKGKIYVFDFMSKYSGALPRSKAAGTCRKSLSST